MDGLISDICVPQSHTCLITGTMQSSNDPHGARRACPYGRSRVRVTAIRKALEVVPKAKIAEAVQDVYNSLGSATATLNGSPDGMPSTPGSTLRGVLATTVNSASGSGRCRA